MEDGDEDENCEDDVGDDYEGEGVVVFHSEII